MLQKLTNFYHRLYVLIVLHGLPVKRTHAMGRFGIRMDQNVALILYVQVDQNIG